MPRRELHALSKMRRLTGVELAQGQDLRPEDGDKSAGTWQCALLMLENKMEAKRIRDRDRMRRLRANPDYVQQERVRNRAQNRRRKMKGSGVSDSVEVHRQKKSESAAKTSAREVSEWIYQEPELDLWHSEEGFVFVSCGVEDDRGEVEEVEQIEASIDKLNDRFQSVPSQVEARRGERKEDTFECMIDMEDTCENSEPILSFQDFKVDIKYEEETSELMLNKYKQIEKYQNSWH